MNEPIAGARREPKLGSLGVGDKGKARAVRRRRGRSDVASAAEERIRTRDLTFVRGRSVRHAQHLGVVRRQSQALGPRREIKHPDVSGGVARDEFPPVGPRGDATERVTASRRHRRLIRRTALRLPLHRLERGSLPRGVGSRVHHPAHGRCPRHGMPRTWEMPQPDAAVGGASGERPARRHPALARRIRERRHPPDGGGVREKAPNGCGVDGV